MSGHENHQKGQEGLERCRQDIDKIDREILSLLSERQQIATTIGRIKRALGIKIIDPGREERVMQLLSSRGDGLLSRDAIRHIFAEIISAARAVQELPIVAYLGPEATFSHQAAMTLFGHSTSFIPADSLNDVFALVETGRCGHGVVPVENSFEGPVGTTHDLLYTHDLRIHAELYLRVRHHLLSKAGCLEEIRRIYSHPMAFSQCGSWTRKCVPNAQVVEVSSTACAAKMAAGDRTSAAVGSRLAAETYGLGILAGDIEDRPDNLTRFLAIGKTSVEPTGRDKTSVVLSVNHEPGALHKVLEPLALRNINMTRIESRPLKARRWEYLFFLDLEGHVQDGSVGEALRDMEACCSFMKRLGSYPAGGEPCN